MRGLIMCLVATLIVVAVSQDASAQLRRRGQCSGGSCGQGIGGCQTSITQQATAADLATIAAPATAARVNQPVSQPSAPPPAPESTDGASNCTDGKCNLSAKASLPKPKLNVSMSSLYAACRPNAGNSVNGLDISKVASRK